MHNFTVSAQDIFIFRRLSVFTVRFTGILQVLMQIMKCFVLSYWLVKWLWYRVYNQKVVSSSSHVFFFFIPSFDSFNFIYYRDVPRPLKNEILDHSISKGWCVTHKMSQSAWNIFRDSRPYYSQNIRLKIIHYACCLNFSQWEKVWRKVCSKSWH